MPSRAVLQRTSSCTRDASTLAAAEVVVATRRRRLAANGLGAVERTTGVKEDVEAERSTTLNVQGNSMEQVRSEARPIFYIVVDSDRLV